MEEERETLKVALVGNPNSGKTSLFNKLTGLHQKVGNFPGVTVEKKSGRFTVKREGGLRHVSLVDLPGTYSLEPRSMDEKVAAEIVLDTTHTDHPDLTLLVLDSSHLKTSLYLALQVLEKQIPAILVLNMSDQLERTNAGLSVERLSELLDVPVVLTNGRTGSGLNALKQTIAEHGLKPSKCNWKDKDVPLHAIIKRILADVRGEEPVIAHRISNRLDDVLTHRVWGYVFFVLVLGVMFQSIYSWAAYPMEWIEYGFGAGATYLKSVLPDSFITRCLVEGVWAGLGGVIIFIPQIAFLFLCITLLEETGYMARVSFILDRSLRKFGLQGRSVVPLIGGVACAVPAIMAARTISNRKERLLTIMVTPFMSCSARLPVYTLLISLVIPQEYFLGVFGYQGMTLLFMYLLGVAGVLVLALVLNKLIKTDEESHFIMELPDYRLPRLTNVFMEIVRKVWQFVASAGKIIILISIFLWLGASYGPSDRFRSIEEKFATAEEGSEQMAAKEAELLENSYIGIMGKKLDPVIQPLGFDWKIGIALITSFAAREVFVGTMATIYSVGDGDEVSSIREKMKKQTKPGTNEPLYDLPFGLSLLVFYAFAMQCISTIAVVKQETGTWKWPLIQLAVMTGVAYLSSLVVYNLVVLF